MGRRPARQGGSPVKGTPVVLEEERGVARACSSNSKRRTRKGGLLQEQATAPRIPGWESDPHAREAVRLRVTVARAREERGVKAACCLHSKRRRARRQAPGACRRLRGSPDGEPTRTPGRQSGQRKQRFRGCGRSAVSVQLVALTPSDGVCKAAGSRSPPPSSRTTGWESDPDAREDSPVREPSVPVAREERGTCAACCTCSKRRRARAEAPGASARSEGMRTHSRSAR